MREGRERVGGGMREDGRGGEDGARERRRSESGSGRRGRVRRRRPRRRRRFLLSRFFFFLVGYLFFLLLFVDVGNSRWPSTCGEHRLEGRVPGHWSQFHFVACCCIGSRRCRRHRDSRNRHGNRRGAREAGQPLGLFLEPGDRCRGGERRAPGDGPGDGASAAAAPSSPAGGDWRLSCCCSSPSPVASVAS